MKHCAPSCQRRVPGELGAHGSFCVAGGLQRLHGDAWRFPGDQLRSAAAPAAGIRDSGGGTRGMEGGLGWVGLGAALAASRPAAAVEAGIQSKNTPECDIQVSWDLVPLSLQVRSLGPSAQSRSGAWPVSFRCRRIRSHLRLAPGTPLLRDSSLPRAFCDSGPEAPSPGSRP